MSIIAQSSSKLSSKIWLLLILSFVIVCGFSIGFTLQTKQVNSSSSPLLSAGKVASFGCATASLPSATQCQSLVDLYKSTNGKSWTTATGWLTDLPSCDWHGILCNPQGSVISIDLSSNNLVGPLPDSLGQLTSLKMLGLWDNQISGAIPDTIGNLNNLSILDLSSNRLTGVIPTTLQNLLNLNTLWLSNNRLSGTIPTSLEKLEKMTSLHLERNQLSGTPPTGLLALPNIEELVFSYNSLDSTDPFLRSSANNHNIQTQTISPSDLRVAQTDANSIALAWTPIDYQDGDGFYEVSYRTDNETDFIVYGTTAAKDIGAMTIEDLLPNTNYHFSIRTFSAPNPPQINAIWSKQSASITHKTLAAPAPPSDLTITALEITQGLQNLTNDMPLIAKRLTWVRAYAQSDLSDIGGVRAQLSAFRDGNELAGSPLAMEYDPITVQVDGGNRLNLEDSFQFSLPTSWLTGTVTFRVEVNHDASITESDPENNVREETLTFHPSDPLSLVMVPIKLHENGDSSQPAIVFKTDDPLFETVIANSYRYMPVAEINWREHDQILEPDCDGDCVIESSTAPVLLLQQLEEMRLAEEKVSRFYESTTNEHWIGMVAPEFFFGGLGIRPQKEFWRTYSAWSSIAGIYSATYASPYEIGGSLSIMHEVGHNLGMMHIDCHAGETNTASAFPYSATDEWGCSLDKIDQNGYYGFDVYYQAAGLEKPIVISNNPLANKSNQAYPMMSYKFPGWPSPYKYCQLLFKFGVECTIYPFDSGVVGATGEPTSTIDLEDVSFGLRNRINIAADSDTDTDVDLENSHHITDTQAVSDSQNVIKPEDVDTSQRTDNSDTGNIDTVSIRIIDVDPVTEKGSQELVNIQKAEYGHATSNGQILYYLPQTESIVDEKVTYTASNEDGQRIDYDVDIWALLKPSAILPDPSIMLPLIVNQ